MAKKKRKTIWTKNISIPAKWINKFTIVGLVFLIWIAFFDSHNLVDSYKVSRSLDRMHEEKEDQIQKIAEAKENWKDLDGNKEKFAREKYFMHKADEEIFIIEKSTK